jgi:cbb3-type cytochrome oxidase subunit 3
MIGGGIIAVFVILFVAGAYFAYKNGGKNGDR